MTSPDPAMPTIGGLITDTERNLKRIEAVSDKYLAPILNEWRYATRHVANLLDSPNNADERCKATNHLERAYLDSCEILLSILLGECKRFRESVGDYADIMRTYIKDYDAWLAKILAAQRAQGETDDGDRLVRAQGLSAHCKNLSAFLEVVCLCREDLAASIAKARRKDRRDGIVFFCVLLGAVVGIVEIAIKLLQ